jgi:glucose/arabinose dehydrogenase
MRRLLAPAAVALALAALPAAAQAAPSVVKVGDFDNPVHVAGPPKDPARVFVVEQGGLVKVVVNGQAAATPFLDLTGDVSLAEERGLLSIAFANDYATSGRFYVFLTTNGTNWPAGVDDGDILILRGLRSAQNPNVADGDSLEIVDVIDHSASNHNGGQLAFGPDGALYASVGDNLTGANAQSGNKLGKILRYADPRTDAEPTIWAKGLRNPWRFSFDRVSGDAWIGDVGESTQEEIDHVGFTTAGGHNFGWPGCEGTLGDCGGFTAPVMTFAHRAAYAAIIGGFVVRDPGLPSLAGRYLFGDLAKPSAFSAAVTAPSPRPEPGIPTAGTRSFGEDGCGRLYVASAASVSRITEAASTACVPPVSGTQPPPGGGQQPPPGGGGGVADTTKPAVTVKRGKRGVRAFVLKLRSDEDARATVKARGYKTRSVVLDAGVTKKVKVRAKRKTIRTLRSKRKAVRKVRIRVVDAAGNATLRTPKLRVR